MKFASIEIIAFLFYDQFVIMYTQQIFAKNCSPIITILSNCFFSVSIILMLNDGKWDISIYLVNRETSSII